MRLIEIEARCTVSSGTFRIWLRKHCLSWLKFTRKGEEAEDWPRKSASSRGVIWNQLKLQTTDNNGRGDLYPFGLFYGYPPPPPPPACPQTIQIHFHPLTSTNQYQLSVVANCYLETNSIFALFALST